MKKIQDVDIENKKVLLRVGFDVSVEDGQAKELFKIKAVKETVDYLLSRNAKVAMLSWLGRPGGKKDPKFSFAPIADDIAEALDCKVVFVPDCIGGEVMAAVEKLESGEVAMLENVRYYPGEGDIDTGEAYTEEYARQLAAGFDIFINDALSQSHRDQASIAGVPKLIPSYAGLLLQKEIEELDKAKDAPAHPAVAVIGGAKIETKLPVIKVFEKEYDYILVGGKIANEAIDQKVEFSEKVMLPIDFQGDRLDIGPKTLEKYQAIIRSAKTVVWNGPMGKFEEAPYNKGTEGILDAILESEAFSVMGGGESLEILEARGAMDRISFVSTGGGAMLEYMSGKKLPGLKALEK